MIFGVPERFINQEIKGTGSCRHTVVPIVFGENQLPLNHLWRSMDLENRKSQDARMELGVPETNLLCRKLIRILQTKTNNWVPCWLTYVRITDPDMCRAAAMLVQIRPGEVRYLLTLFGHCSHKKNPACCHSGRIQIFRASHGCFPISLDADMTVDLRILILLYNC